MVEDASYDLLRDIQERVAALTAQGLSTARMDAAVTSLRAIVEHREDLVKTRTQTVNRLHVVLTHLIPADAPRGLSADGVAEMLRRVRPRDLAGKTMRGLAVDLVAEVRQLDRRIAKAVGDIEAAVVESGSSLTSAVRDRGSERGQDPRPGRLDSPVPLERCVRQLYRYRAHRGFLR